MRSRIPLIAAALVALMACKTLHPIAADAAANPAVQHRPPQVVQMQTEDHWTLVGTLYPVPAADDTGAAVLMVHQLGSNRGEWGPLVQRLQTERAVTVLTLDLRGHGESTRGPQGDAVTWESFGTDPEHWARLSRDVEAGVRFLRTSGGATRVLLVGSSIGSSAALDVAARDGDIAGVVMLSPGLTYHGFDIRGPMAHYGENQRPALLLAGDQDAQSAAAVPVLAEAGGPLVEHEVFGGVREHGVSMCNANPARWARVALWVRRVLGIPPRSTLTPTLTGTRH